MDEDDEQIDLTRDELYQQAREAEIPGRSTMSEEELAEAIQDRA